MSFAERALRFPFQAGTYLSEQGFSLVPGPETPSYSPREKMDLFVRSGVPLIPDVASGILWEMARAGDLEGIQELHNVAIGYFVARTTMALLPHRIDPKENPDAGSPLEELQKLLSRQTLVRVATHEYSEWFIPEMVAADKKGLRQLVEAGLLDPAVEGQMEEWLIANAPGGQNQADKIRRDRRVWFSGWRLSQTGEFNLAGLDHSARQELIRDQIERFGRSGQFTEAKRLLISLPAAEQVDHVGSIVFGLVATGRQEEAVTLLAGVRKAIVEATYSPDQSSKLFRTLVRPHADAADLNGMSETLKLADREGHTRLCQDLGVTEAQLSGLLVLAGVAGNELDGLREGGLEILLKGTYRASINDRRGGTKPEAREYVDLLIPRVAFLGEKNIGFPPPSQIQDNYRVAMECAIASDLRGDRDQLIFWLSRLNRIPAGGPSAVQYILDRKYPRILSR